MRYRLHGANDQLTPGHPNCRATQTEISLATGMGNSKPRNEQVPSRGCCSVARAPKFSELNAKAAILLAQAPSKMLAQALCPAL